MAKHRLPVVRPDRSDPDPTAEVGGRRAAAAGPAPQLASLDRLLMIADIARTVNDFRPLEETLIRICERVSRLSGYDITAFFMPDDRAQALVIRGSWGINPAYIQYVNRDNPIWLVETGQLDLAPAAEAYHTGQPVTMADVELEPRFESRKQSARLAGYRSITCIPVILRSQVIGVLTCYGHQPHQPSSEEQELLQLVGRLAGIAIETARIAEGKRQALAELRQLSERLHQQNEELSRLSAIQSRLTGELAQPDATAVERTARALAEITDRAILVSGPTGYEVAYQGPPEAREAMALIAARRDIAQQLRREPLLSVEEHSCLRIGVAEMPLGMIVLRPGLDDPHGIAALAATHAAAVLGAELHSERANRALEMYARPAVLMALAHGLYGSPQIREAAGILGIPVDAQVRLALFRCSTADAAQRLSHHVEALTGAGWPAIAMTCDGRDSVALLRPGGAAALRRAGAALRERHPEVEQIGVSSCLPGLAALPSGRHQARTAAAVDSAGRCPTGTTFFEDLGTFGELVQDLPPGRAEELVRHTLGPLREHDEAHGTQLVKTLAAYVRHQGRVKEAAAELHLHPNTLHQRLRRAAELGDLDLHDFRDLGRLVLALEWDRMLRARAGSE